MNILNLESKIVGNRIELREQVVTEFLKEAPGTGTGVNSSKYTYVVESLEDGSNIILKRPANLNKGFDFEVHATGIKFRDKGKVNMPSHDNIIEDLKNKQTSDEKEYEKVKIIINKLYNCLNVSEEEYRAINFNVGHPIEGVLKSIKWLFIEQDITYWNWSGRGMLYSKLKEEKLC